MRSFAQNRDFSQKPRMHPIHLHIKSSKVKGERQKIAQRLKVRSSKGKGQGSRVKGERRGSFEL